MHRKHFLDINDKKYYHGNPFRWDTIILACYFKPSAISKKSNKFVKQYDTQLQSCEISPNCEWYVVSGENGNMLLGHLDKGNPT